MSSGDEGEWEAEEEQEDDEDSQEESYHDDDDSNSDKKPAARRTTKEGEDAAGTKQATSSSKPDRRKRLRRVDFDAEGDDDEIDRLPSHQRLTHKGGYMHTKNSRLKISQANKGKSPWNKGKNRSETAKAKISAGVRARNHAILLIKLGKLGLTEEEWFRKKKQIKLLRERVRKAKVSAAKYEETKKQEMLEKTTERGDALKKQLAELMQAIGTDEESNDEKVSRSRIQRRSWWNCQSLCWRFSLLTVAC
jgi:NUMOD3 motif